MPGCGRLEWAVVPRFRRVRRPLLALIALVAAVAIGYGVQALGGGGTTSVPTAPVVTTTR